MILTEKELEELLAINEQAKIFIPKLTYYEELGGKLFNCMKNIAELSRESIQQAHNNYLVLHIIGLYYLDSDVFKKLDNYMENEYLE